MRPFTSSCRHHPSTWRYREASSACSSSPCGACGRPCRPSGQDRSVSCQLTCRSYQLRSTHADQAVLGLELLLGLLVVVDETEALRRTTTELGAETEDDNTLLVRLVELGEALSEVVTRDVGTGGVRDSDNELLAVKQAVGDELRSPDGDGSGGVLGLLVIVRVTGGSWRSLTRQWLLNKDWAILGNTMRKFVLELDIVADARNREAHSTKRTGSPAPHPSCSIPCFAHRDSVMSVDWTALPPSQFLAQDHLAHLPSPGQVHSRCHFARRRCLVAMSSPSRGSHCRRKSSYSP